MCGIAGVVAVKGIELSLLKRMAGSIAHRGPDDHGIWIDPSGTIGFAHRRLSIVDLSPHGHQPMASADNRFTISYNGEIYNHGALRAELDEAGASPEGGWRGHSDTETLVQAISTWGLKQTLDRAVGMFAFALWDQRESRLSLVRDRFGEKPLYYGWAGNDFLFASELKAMRLHPQFSGEIDRQALSLFAARTYIPAPHSIYRRVFKLEPGCILAIDLDAAKTPLDQAPTVEAVGGVTLDRYWSYPDVIERGIDNPIAGEGEALDALEQSLATAISGQSVADVPVGAFLSGGIDSSSIVALYQKYSASPVRTYTIGFAEAGYDETAHAKAVAQQLGTLHHEHYVSVDEARDVIPLLPAMYDEPFADSSQIPTYLVSKFARREVTVALTGDGGDELFGGYNRHFLAPRMWNQVERVPSVIRRLGGSALSRIPSQAWQTASNFLPGSRQPNLGAKIQKGLRVASAVHRFDDVYESFLDEWRFEPSPVVGASGGGGTFDLGLPPTAGDAERMMYCDAVSYLPDDILCKVDRASMAVSLETRVPFLDHRVAELAARIPLSMKIKGSTGKHILRQLLYREAPRSLFERPKAGFAVPVGEWIKGPLRPWAEELLDPSKMASEGWFNTQVVQRRWRDHLSGRRESTPAIWAILMFQAWLRNTKDER